jgi:hypothetical protein
LTSESQASEFSDEQPKTETAQPATRLRRFRTGATRDTDEDKLDYDGFLSPLVLERYARYMHRHRVQSDGTVRDSSNWKAGIPRKQYVKSLYRHFMDVVLHQHDYAQLAREKIEDAICGCLFNLMGLLHEVLLERDVG